MDQEELNLFLFEGYFLPITRCRLLVLTNAVSMLHMLYLNVTKLEFV